MRKLITTLGFIAAGVTYTLLIVATDLVAVTKPENLHELLAIYGYLSIPIFILLLFATYKQFAPIVKGTRSKTRVILCILLSLLYFLIFWSLCTFVFIRIIDSTSSVEVLNFKNYR